MYIVPYMYVMYMENHVHSTLARNRHERDEKTNMNIYSATMA